MKRHYSILKRRLTILFYGMVGSDIRYSQRMRRLKDTRRMKSIYDNSEMD